MRRFIRRLPILLHVLAAVACVLLTPLTTLAQPTPPAPVAAPAPSPEEAILRKIYTETLAHGQAYENLRALTSRYPGRLSGSKVLESAVTWATALLGTLDLDRVYAQEVKVPHWERGAPESVRLLPAQGDAVPLAALALGSSVATPEGGLTAGVVEVHSLDELATLGRARIEGKIVFFNRPMDPALFRAFSAYGGAADQRNRGPAAAAKLGAVAALTRSLTHALDDLPHAGNTTFPPELPRIPAAALSTLAADRLSAALAADPALRVEIKTHARILPDAISHNVIGEIRGSEFPDRIIVVGGHLDSWDITLGAHDDGAGVVQAIEVLRIFRALGLTPRHTLRAVLFTNEENGLAGAVAYAATAREAGERHVLAIESDSGGTEPRGFSFGSPQNDAHLRAARWHPLFEPYGISFMRKGSGGADVIPLAVQGATVAEIASDSQRYFDYHHTAIDTLDKVNPRELHLGAAALASLIWLVDTQGL
jgi:carboxypeptidase Q